MKLSELFEALTAQDIKDIQNDLNRSMYMPKSRVANGDSVMKLNLPSIPDGPAHRTAGKAQHFAHRVTGDNTGRRIGSVDDYTKDEVKELLARARIDPKLGYSKDIGQFASWPGPGDYPQGYGYQVVDPKTRLIIPFVVKPNRRGVRLASRNTVYTMNGEIEPRNEFKAKTIYRLDPNQKIPSTQPYNPPLDKELNNLLASKKPT